MTVTPFCETHLNSFGESKESKTLVIRDASREVIMKVPYFF